jgi:hypothetical protein
MPPDPVMRGEDRRGMSKNSQRPEFGRNGKWNGNGVTTTPSAAKAEFMAVSEGGLRLISFAALAYVGGA